jgi:nicotinate-nucleotide adenylyltransferase
MRVALFGGAFNPIHFGHLLMAESAREAFHIDRIIFLPTGIPPHKSPALIDNCHRLAMIRRAIASNGCFTVDDWEIRQRRIVYSMEAIGHFHQIYGKGIYFLTGSDSFRGIDSWLGGRRLLDECRFLVAERPDCSWKSLPASLRRKARLVPGAPVPYASCDVRRRVAQKRSIRYQVPETVEKYIYKHKLYRSALT